MMRAELPHPQFDAGFRIILIRLVEKQTHHRRRVDLPQRGQGRFVERNNNAALRAPRFSQRADQRMMHAPGRFVFQFEIKNHVVLGGEFDDFFQRGHALPHELSVEPQSCVELANLRQRKIFNQPFPVGGALQSRIVNRHEARVARQVQIGLDETGAQRHRALERRHGIFRRVSGSAAMRDDPGFPHEGSS